MNKKQDPMISREELAASLNRLGIKELEERMEVSPLLAASDVQVDDRCACESCCSKIDIEPHVEIDLGGEIPVYWR